jgi:hypothetical protein
MKYLIALGLLSIGLAATAQADPYDPFALLDPPEANTPCVMVVPGHWLCPEGFSPPPNEGNTP